jgi:hypothetical protein
MIFSASSPVNGCKQVLLACAGVLPPLNERAPYGHVMGIFGIG